MQKFPMVIIGVVLALVAFVVLQGFFASDQTRIRWQIEAGVEAFNEQHTGNIVDRLAENYRDVDMGVTRSDARRFLAAIFLTELDPKTQQFNFEIESDLSSLEITEHEENTYRSVAPGVLRPKSGATKPWNFELALWWREVDGDWLVFRSQFTTSTGRRPF